MGITLEGFLETPRDVDEHEVREQFQSALTDDGRSLNAVAGEVGIGYSTLSAWRTGKYAGDNTKVTDAVQAWLTRRVAQERTRLVLPKAPDFVLTKSASEILDVLEFAQAAVRLGLVVGAAGIGKTTAFRAYQQRYPTSVWVVTMQPCHSRARAMLEELEHVLKLPREWRSIDISRAVISRLAGTKGLMIIDEAQHLDADALDQLRSIYDATGIGFVLGGNAELLTKIGAVARTPNLAQIYSRVGLRYNRARVLLADVKAILDAWDIDGEAERNELKGIALKPGGLRVLTNVIGQAFMLAAGAGASRLDLSHIQAAYQQLAGAA